MIARSYPFFLYLRVMKFIRNLLTFVLICAVLILGMMFAGQNTATVPLDLLIVYLPERSVALWVVLAFTLGGVIGMLTSVGLVLRLRASLLQANRKMRGVEKARQKEEAQVQTQTQLQPEAETLLEARKN